MQITHEHARKLIQFRLDGGLRSAEHETLSAHLQDCSECQAYAAEINEVETVLRPMLKRKWSAQPIPLSITSLRGNSQKTQRKYQHYFTYDGNRCWLQFNSATGKGIRVLRVCTQKLPETHNQWWENFDGDTLFKGRKILLEKFLRSLKPAFVKIYIPEQQINHCLLIGTSQREWSL